MNFRNNIKCHNAAKETATSRVTATEKLQEKKTHSTQKQQPTHRTPRTKAKNNIVSKTGKVRAALFFLCHLANLVLLDIYRVSYFFFLFYRTMSSMSRI